MPIVKTKHTSRLIPIVLLLCVSIVGCGPSAPRSKLPVGDVEIAIKYGDQPVSEGHLELNSADTGEGSGGYLNVGGVVQLSSVVAGNYVVTINLADAPGALSQPTSSTTDSHPKIPPIFHRVSTSPLRVEVKQGEVSKYQFNLKDLENVRPTSSHESQQKK